ncbi:uncharacterized protein LOC124645868 [Helicoverpa zea]|uniref:uncharacterized protein LOC124629825 n=1 Tax=Helicoverpa zea TaxID=7113 RepID=UPI001F55DA6B|nr:uncharacterized protein LOC124629825 [Helicoverpa zea]XP_047020002.1 uncharacterized protein LOC124630252 [Helicoverpa zea]XP_047022777.1 uncharacterized protein LOC124632136 [Helicoverpa zea]XP_047036940.1 uncharacterized protein LOC124642556 [Helicoverpa zea]XP_047041785.1 uncharacterized protein LOC124645868 [Helicoverpa zea]
MNPMDQLDSQPFFIEEESSQYLGESRKRRQEYCDDENQSQSLLIPKKRVINASDTFNINTQFEKEDEKNSSDSDEKMKCGEDSKPEEETTSNVKQCVFCIFDKELDKRNYYFGNLLIGELQFLPPCMRSEAYINILKYIDALKHQHRDKSNK